MKLNLIYSKYIQRNGNILNCVNREAIGLINNNSIYIIKCKNPVKQCCNV
jgi:hypothetical protein